MNMNVGAIKNRRRQQGLAMVEMAIVLPVLLLLMLATAEMGRAFFQYNTLTKSVRDGVRHLASYAINPSTGIFNISPELANDARNLVVYGNSLGSGQALLPGLTTGDVLVDSPDGVNVRVRAAYQYAPMLGNQLPLSGWFGGDGISTTFTLRASTLMRAL